MTNMLVWDAEPLEANNSSLHSQATATASKHVSGETAGLVFFFLGTFVVASCWESR